MKRARIIVLGIAIVSALVAAILAKNFMGNTKVIQTVKTDYDTVKVLVARSAIGVGTAVNKDDLKWQSWPKDGANSGYIIQSKQKKAITLYAGSIARVSFLPGEPIKKQKLIKASNGGVMAAIVRKGMRAVSTPIREETAAGNFIQPSDRVDVILTRKMRKENGQGSQHVSDTIFRNVNVLAIGQNIEMKGGKKVAAGKTATLELTPEQSETMALARSMGELTLSLRSLAEASRNGSAESDVPLNAERSSGISILKYGVQSRAYGVN